MKMNESERGKDSRTEEEHAEQPQRPRVRINRLMIVALNDVKKDLTKNKERDKQFSSNAELPSDFQNNTGNRRTFFVESEQPSRNEPWESEAASGYQSSLPQRNLQNSDSERPQQFNSHSHVEKSSGFGNNSENRGRFRKDFREPAVVRNDDKMCKIGSENFLPHKNTHSSDNERHRQLASRAENSSGFQNGTENRKSFHKESRQFSVRRNEDRMYKSGTENSSLPHRDNRSSGFRTTNQSGKKFHNFRNNSYEKERPVLTENKSDFNTLSNQKSVSNFNTNNSIFKDNLSHMRRANSHDSIVDYSGNWDSVKQNEVSVNKKSTPNESHASKNMSLTRSQAWGSCESMVNFYKPKRNLEKTWPHDKFERENKRDFQRENSSLFKTNFSAANHNRLHQGPHKSESFNKPFGKVNGIKFNSRDKSFPQESQWKQHDQRSKFKGGVEKESDYFSQHAHSGRINMKQTDVLKRHLNPNKDPMVQNHLKEGVSSRNFSEGEKGLNTDDCKSNLHSKNNNFIKNHHHTSGTWDSAEENLSDEPLVSGKGRKFSEGKEDLNTDNCKSNLHSKNNNDFIKNHHHTSGTWDSAEENLSDEPLVSENIKAKPEIALDKEKPIPINICSDSNAESLKSLSFACDIDPNLFQKEVFFTLCSEELAPIPAPRPAQDSAVHFEITALPNKCLSASSENQVRVENTCTASNEETCTASNENTCATSNENTCATSNENTCATSNENICTASNEAGCMFETEALPNEDSFSVSSGNRNSLENSYAASNEAEDSDSQETSNSEESEYVLQPEHARAITKYLKEIEKERSVSTDIAKKVLFDVNKVLRYRLNEISC